MSSLLRIGILTISDTSARDAATDRSGPILSQAFEADPSSAFRVTQKAIVADNVEAIQAIVRGWVDVESDDAVDAVVSTGGTGFGARDVTPEAFEPLIDRQTSGLTVALNSHSLTKTPMAALSRLITGVRLRRTNSSSVTKASTSEGVAGGALLVALPGSSKAVQECCEVLLGSHDRQGVLRHALELLRGGSGEAQHAAMQGSLGIRHSSSAIKGTETDTGSSHTHIHHQAHHHHQHKQHHHHHHNHHQHHNHGSGIHAHHAPKPRTAQPGDAGYKTHDPGQGASLRHRTSPYPIISMAEALSLIDKHTPDGRQKKPIVMAVNDKLVGHVLAQDVVAKRDLPPGPTTNVDGYAVNASQTPAGTYAVRTSFALEDGLKTGEVFRINTGQALPRGTDAVVMVEDTRLLEADEAGEERTIEILAQVDSGENVRRSGSDVKKDQVVLSAGLRLTEIGGEVGTLAFLGYTEIQVYPRPTVALLSTGNELYDTTKVSQSDEDAWGFRVFDANRPSLSSALKGAGYDVVDLGIVRDNMDATLGALNRGLEQADVIISTGGTSMGESDLLKPLIERHISGGKVHFGRVAMKPGKPTTFATASGHGQTDRVLFALPGNPASALVCFYVFVMPALRRLSGLHGDSSLARVTVEIQNEMRLDPRPEFHRVIITVGPGGKLLASSTGSQRSSGMHSMASANGLVCVPAASEGSPRSLAKGSTVEAILLGALN